ncbi:MAG TPA: molybdopterin-guanine dinucleotide biosynthesis protein B [Rhodocyclaceae bacterium]|nr:molybdopterin-guanine dinucleotide biosynthesis protein B [Rhodocyclaceae bacterium]
MKVFGFTGFSGSGKTTLIEQVIPLFVQKGLRVSLIKHAHHHFDIDKPGKDSYRHREAGCTEVMIVSSNRWAMMHELRGEAEPTLDEQIARISPCDLLLIEGYKHSDLAKIEVHRPDHVAELLYPGHGVVAVASDKPLRLDVPVLDLNSPSAVAEFVLNYTHLNK